MILTEWTIFVQLYHVNLSSYPYRYAEDHITLAYRFWYFLHSSKHKNDNIDVEKADKNTLWSESMSELYRPSDSSLSAKLVPTFADRGCHVISVTDPYDPYSRLSRPEPLLFLSSSSSIVLMRLSGPHSRPTTQEIW
jgi:hypothetical protein